MAETPPPQRPSRLRAFWSRRSWKGKAGIIVGAVVLALVVIGVAAPPEEKPESESSPAAATSEQPTTGTTTTAEATTEAAPPPVLVSRVIDGDTVDLDSGDRIQLVQIDSPERKGECYGKKAGTVLRQLLPMGTEVRIVRDLKLDNIDRGRLLRYVFVGERNINLALVRKGAASVWYFNGDRGRFAKQLLAAAKEARAAKRGAWGACEADLDPTSAFLTRAKVNEPDSPATLAGGCEPGYDPCLPIKGDLDCPDVEAMGLAPVSVSGSDRYRLDGDGDGVGCES
jgi:endonuclease YncB( thermonuclease family)